MGKSASAPIKVCRTVSLIIALMLALGWTAVAYAQTPADAQYDSPTATASGNPANTGAGGGAAGGGVSGGIGGSIGAKGAKILPLTGGELSLPLIALGTVALASIVLLPVVGVRRVIELSRDWQHASGARRHYY